MSTFGPSLCNITCGQCGHEADLEAFTARPVAGQFEPNSFQCPNCQRAWRIDVTPISKDGFTQKNKLVPEPPRF